MAMEPFAQPEDSPLEDLEDILREAEAGLRLAPGSARPASDAVSAPPRSAAAPPVTLRPVGAGPHERAHRGVPARVPSHAEGARGDRPADVGADRLRAAVPGSLSREHAVRERYARVRLHPAAAGLPRLEQPDARHRREEGGA